MSASLALEPALASLALLLAASAVAKLGSPAAAAAALASLRLPSGRLAVRAAAAIELAVGMLCLVRPGRAADAAVAVLFAAFAAIVAAQRRAGGGAPCGCLGGAATDASRAHLVFDLAAATVAAAAATAPPAHVLATTARHPLEVAIAGAAVLAGAWLAAAVLTLLPGALGSYRRPA